MKVLDRNAPHSQLEFSFFAEAKENGKRAFSAERKKNLQFFSCPARLGKIRRITNCIAF